MRTRFPIVWFGLGVALCACTPQPPVARFSVEEYRADAALRRATVNDCASSPALADKDPDCLHAIRAESLEGVGSLRKLPPLGLKAQ